MSFLENVIDGSKALLKKGKQFAAGATLVTAGAAAAVGLGPARAEAAEPVTVPVMVVAGSEGLPGANNSQWNGSFKIINPNDDAAEGYWLVLPQGNNDPATAKGANYRVPAHSSIEISTIRDYTGLSIAGNETFDGLPIGIEGNASLSIVPTDDDQVQVEATYWNAQDLETATDPDPDHPQLTRMVQAMAGQDTLAAPGDKVVMTTPDFTMVGLGDGGLTEMHRYNVFIYAEEDGTGTPSIFVHARAKNDDGEPVSLGTATVNLNSNGLTQFTNAMTNQWFLNLPQNYSNAVIEITPLAGKIAVASSSVYNNPEAGLRGVDDGDTLNAKVIPLVEEAHFHTTPDVIEANDTMTYRASVKTREGTEVLSLVIDGGVGDNQPGNGTNELSWTYVGTATVPGTYENNATIRIRSEIGDFERALPGEDLEVVAEQDQHIIPVDDNIRARMSNPQILDQVANILGQVSYILDTTDPGLAYIKSPSQWSEALEVRFNGDVGDHEISEMKFYRTPRAMGVADWFNNGNFLTIHGLTKDSQKELYTLITGEDHWE